MRIGIVWHRGRGDLSFGLEPIAWLRSPCGGGVGRIAREAREGAGAQGHRGELSGHWTR